MRVRTSENKAIEEKNKIHKTQTKIRIIYGYKINTMAHKKKVIYFPKSEKSFVFFSAPSSSTSKAE